MNRREFVRGSVLACAGNSFALPPFAKDKRRMFFRLDSTDGASVLRSFVDTVVEVDRVLLPPTMRVLEHPSLPVLFGWLDVDAWEFRPRSAVCSVRYCMTTGKFLRHSVTPLSLGAIGIIDAWVSADGERLKIATATGIRNVFDLTRAGDVGELVSVRKTISPQQYGVQRRI